MQQNDTFYVRSVKYIPYSLILFTIIIFTKIAWHDFINFDDIVFIIENENINTGLRIANILWAFTTGFQGNWIPLTWISHQLDVAIFGLNPGGHHAVSILLHTTNSLLLYTFLNKTTKAPYKSAMVAFLFALHPMHIESVAWISERKDLLSALFMMLTLHSYARYADDRTNKNYIITLALFTCGILSKSMLVTLPILLILLDYWLFNQKRKLTFAKLLKEKIPFAIISILSSILTYIAHKNLDAITELYTFGSRAGKTAIAYITYIYKMFYPAKLAIIYTYSIYPPTWQTIAAAASALLVITISAIYVKNRFPYILVGWFWYLISLFPVSGIIQIGNHSIANRYTYIPYIGLFIMLIWGFADITEHFKIDKRIIASISISLIIISSVITYQQLGYWKDTLTLFRHTVEVTENNWIAETILGSELEKNGKLAEAADHYIAATKAKPIYADAHLKLGHLYGKLEATRAGIESTETGLRYEPTNAEAQYNLGYLYLQEKNIAKAEQQLTILKELNREDLVKMLQQNIEFIKKSIPVQSSRIQN